MRRRKFLAGLVIGTLALFLVQYSLFGQSMMNLELKNIEGQYVTLEEIKGSRLTVIDFWATWCKPCVKSIPELVNLSKEYEGKDVTFIGVNVDSPRNISKVRPFANSLGITYPVLLDTDQELFNELMVSVLPTLIIINDIGERLYTHEGYARGDEKIFKEKIEGFLSNGE